MSITQTSAAILLFWIVAIVHALPSFLDAKSNTLLGSYSAPLESRGLNAPQIIAVTLASLMGLAACLLFILVCCHGPGKS